MFDNLLHQEAVPLLISDIESGAFPGAVLFSGPSASGKLTCALEAARILSCTASPRGGWLCGCRSCLQHKSLVNGNMLLAGPRDCGSEIAAASFAFIRACVQNASYLTAARYLFLRSVRKLTARFNPVLWQGDDRLNKIASVVSSIDEELEALDFPHELPPAEAVEKICGRLAPLCAKLEGGFLYDSIPISQIRNMSAWAHLKAVDGSKTVIIENADRMLEGVRNALLKILEEPPADTVFILTTSRRNAVMPTILSRVRTYSFCERTPAQQHEVVSRVFHREEFSGTIGEYLLTFLPVPPQRLYGAAAEFFRVIAEQRIPEVAAAVKECGGFEPRIALRLFLEGIARAQRKLLHFPAGAQAAAETGEALRACWNCVTVYNQTPQSALEHLVRCLSKINRTYGGCFKCAIM
ncbi:MAG: DNA polymerase III [Treponemataceae bacterium]|nr:DNA polymerase III [Treponemataceae bacterium]